MVIWPSVKPRIEKVAGLPGEPPVLTPGWLSAAFSTLRNPRASIAAALIASSVPGVSRADRLSRLPVGVNCSNERRRPLTTTWSSVVASVACTVPACCARAVAMQPSAAVIDKDSSVACVHVMRVLQEDR